MTACRQRKSLKKLFANDNTMCKFDAGDELYYLTFVLITIIAKSTFLTAKVKQAARKQQQADEAGEVGCHYVG